MKDIIENGIYGALFVFLIQWWAGYYRQVMVQYYTKHAKTPVFIEKMTVAGMTGIIIAVVIFVFAYIVYLTFNKII